MTSPRDQSGGNAETGPGVAREDARDADRDADDVAVPRYDVVSAPVEGIGEAIEEAFTGSDPDTESGPREPEGGHNADRND